MKQQKTCWQKLKLSVEYVGLMVQSASQRVSQNVFGGAQVRRLPQAENEQLVKRLAALRADYNLLKRDTDELLRYADKEIQSLKQTNTGLAEEFDDLQLRVWELEQQVDELLLYIAQQFNPEEAAFVRAYSSGQLRIDLSQLRLGLVGGHSATRRDVVDELSAKHGLQQWVEVPPSKESSLRKSDLKTKLERCDLIVIITGYMNHSLTHAVFALKASGALRGEVALLNFRGKSGVVREVLRLGVQLNMQLK